MARIFFTGIAISFIMASAVNLVAETSKQYIEKGILMQLEDNLTVKNPGNTNMFMVFGGWHNNLYGYRDNRYKGDDKGDYIKTEAYHGGMEICFSDFSKQGPSLAKLRMGLNINSMVKRTTEQRTLYAVPLHSIPEETVPDAEKDIRSRFGLNLGLFIGLEFEWLGIATGLTPKFSGYDEKSREKLDPASSPTNPQYNKVSGRGYIWSDSTMRMNFRLRLGLEQSGYIVLNCYREDYNPDYGTVTSYIYFPVASFFAFKFGGYLHKTQSAFVEPVIKIASLSLGLQVGSIINYHDSNIKRAGIKDGLLASVSLSYAW